MKEGTITVLYGVHSIIHSYYVWKAWKILYKKRPTWKETICIIIHDWGYWGKNYYSEKSNQGHSLLGAKIAGWLFDGNEHCKANSKNILRCGCAKYYRLCLLHSESFCNKFGVEPSMLAKPDEYSWIIANMKWVKWTAKIEKYIIPSEIWIDNVKRNFNLPNDKRMSGTDMVNKLKNELDK